MTDRELTYDIIGAAMEQQWDLGPGFRDTPYGNALRNELRFRGHRVERQKAWPIKYKGGVVGECFTDLIVDRRVIIENKAEEKTSEAHGAQPLNYWRLTGISLELVMNLKPSFDEIPTSGSECKRGKFLTQIKKSFS